MHRHQRLLAARTQMVNGFGDQFLARPALAQNQHARLAWGDLLHDLKDFLHRRGFANDVFQIEARLDLLAQGKITVDEADRLLKAVAAAPPSAEAASEPGAAPRPRWLRINIQKQSEDGHGEKKNVNVRVPISFVKGGMRLGALIAPFAGEKAIARLRERGYDIDLSRLDAEAIETWLKDVDDLNVHIDNGKEQVRITCE